MITKLQMTEKITQIEETRENNERIIDINEDASSTSSIDQNNVMEKQLFQWPSLKTYVSPQLSFDIASEEKDIMECNI